jgi:hypothetical protein
MSDSDNWTPDQGAEYQRLLASPTATAMALIEARAEIERLKFVYDDATAVGKERDRFEFLSESQAKAIDALKVELAAMMKERDAARSDEKESTGYWFHWRDVALKLEAERDAALLELSQVRAELDEAQADSETWRKAYGESQALLGKAVAALSELKCNGCSLRVGFTGSRGYDDSRSNCSHCANARAILADATSQQAADAWRTQQESLGECVDRLEMVQSLAADGYHLRPVEKEAIAKAIKEARRLLDGGSK